MQVAFMRHLDAGKSFFPGGCFLGREETLERKKAGPLGFRTKPWEVA
jgi:hypothetical protein